MSLYLDMWTAVKKLNLEEVNTWIRTIEPAKGYTIRFYSDDRFDTIEVIDVDLLEALRIYQADLIHDIELEKQRNNQS